MIRFGFALLLFIFSFGCQDKGTNSEPSPDIEASQVIMPAPPPGQSVGAVYMSLENKTAKQFTLLHVSSSVADNIEVHRTIYKEGMMQMRPARHLILAPNSTLKLNPGGYHMMLMGLRKEWKAGDAFDLKLEFDGGATLDTQVQVQSPGQ